MNLLKLQYHFIFTKKVKIVSSLLIFFTWVVLVLQSGLVEKGSSLLYNREALISSFIYDGFNIIKIVAVLYSMLLAIYVMYLNKYDVFVVTRRSRIKVILSKLTIILLLEIVFVLYLFVVFGTIWGLLDYSVLFGELASYLIHLIELSVYYALLNSATIIVFSSIFIVIIPFLGYLLSNFSMDYGISIHELEKSSLFLNFFFPDVFIYNKDVLFVYGILTVVDISLLIIVLIIIKYKVDDIII